MIPKISPSFTGHVQIGRNKEDRRKIISALKMVPKSERKAFGASLLNLKSEIEAHTPKNSNYLINVAGYDNEYIAGTHISVTDTNLNKCIALDGVLKTFNGEPVSRSQYMQDMHTAFQNLAYDTIEKSKEHFPNKRIFLDEII